MSAAAATAAAGPLRQFAVLAARNLRQARAGRSVGLTVVFPLTFFAGFMVVFRRLMADYGIAYEQFLPPAIVVQTTALVAMSACYMIAGDARSGLIARYRTLPMSAAVVPAARLVVDAARAAVAVAVILVAAVLVGFRFTAGAARAAGFVLLAVGFAVVLAAGCAALGLGARDPEQVYSALTLPYLVLTTVSTAFVPVDAFPGWLQPVVEVSPFSAQVDALRALSTEGADQRVWPALVWLLVLGLLFGCGRGTFVSEEPMSTVTQASLFAGRNLRRFFRAPPALVYSFAFPVLLLLTQYAVFGRIVGDGDRQHYLERLAPLVVLSTAAFGSPSSAVGFLRDLRGGLVDRLRTMPVAPGALLAGRVAGDVLRIVADRTAHHGCGDAAGLPVPGGAAGRRRVLRGDRAVRPDVGGHRAVAGLGPR